MTETDPNSKTEFDKNARDAMRAFLNRAETRLSTMHRVAGTFVGGAGLLVLFPVFFREGVLRLVSTIVQGQNLLFGLLIAIPFLISLYIPLLALFHLLRDLVRFYYVAQSPGSSTEIFNPRFVLSGLSFSADEDKLAKKQIELYQYREDLYHFLVPFDKRLNYLKQVLGNTPQIVPKTRTPEALLHFEVIKKKSSGGYQLAGDQPSEITKEQIEIFGTALGLTGLVDRDLASEVAKSEVSLARHAIVLRRLVLRYMKALLMFIFTTIISFSVLALVDVGPDWQIVLPLGYAIWAFFVPRVVKWPIDWIYAHSTQNANPKDVAQDIELKEFEASIKKWCYVALPASVAATVVLLLA